MPKQHDLSEARALGTIAAEGMTTALRYVPTDHTLPPEHDMGELESMTKGFAAKLTLDLNPTVGQLKVVLLDLASLARAAYYLGVRAGAGGVGPTRGGVQ